MRWTEFLTTAQLLASGTTECEWRSSVSRAYYGVFHYFREFLESHEIDWGLPQEAGVNLHLGLMNCQIPEVIEIARLVYDLRLLRQIADYRVAIPFGITSGPKAIGDVERIVQKFNSILSADTENKIAKNIKDYLTSIGRNYEPST